MKEDSTTPHYLRFARNEDGTGSVTAVPRAKWRPCEFKACGRTEHIGRARWNAKLGGWEVREMRPGYPAAPSLYGPSAVYSIWWLTKVTRDVRVAATIAEAEARERYERRCAVVNAIHDAINSGIHTKRNIMIKACSATASRRAFVAEVFAEQVDAGNVYRRGRQWLAVRDEDIPF